MKMKKPSELIRSFASPAVTAGLLFLLALLIVQGTLYEAFHGIYEAQLHVFDAWIVLLAGAVPFPGVKLVLALLAANLAAAAGTRIEWSARKAGLLLIHGGIALLLLGALGTSLFRSEGMVTLGKGESAHTGSTGEGRDLELPVTLSLNDFRIASFPGTDAPRDYESLLHARGAGIDRDVVISMNRPFRYRDYTFYQTSYAPAETGMISVLTVVKNPFKAVPPIAGIVIALGLAVHFLVKPRVRPRRDHA